MNRFAPGAGMLAVALLSLGSGLPGCTPGSLPEATGPRSQVEVVWDPAVPDSLRRAIVQRLEAPRERLGQTERFFEVVERPEPAGAPRARLAVVVTCLETSAGTEDGGGVFAAVRRTLGPRLADRTTGVAWGIFPNVFARGQRLAEVLARSPETLERSHRTLFDSLRVQLDDAALGLIRDVLRAYVDEPAEQRVRRRYGYRLLTPRSYRVVEHLPGWSDAVEYQAAAPVRVLTVAWLRNVNPGEAASPDFLLGFQRDAMWRLHHDVLEGPLEWEVPPAAANPIAVLSGIWQNRDEVAGGPVRTRFVYDAPRRRLFALQMQVFAPGRPKQPWLRELRAVASTFRLEGETP